MRGMIVAGCAGVAAILASYASNEGRQIVEIALLAGIYTAALFKVD